VLKYTSSLECGGGGRVQDARTWLIEGTVAALRNGTLVRITYTALIAPLTRVCVRTV